MFQTVSKARASLLKFSRPTLKWRFPPYNLIPSRSFGLEPRYANLVGTNTDYLDDLYLRWKEDPSSVHPSWAAVFQEQEGGQSRPSGPSVREVPVPQAAAFQPREAHAASPQAHIEPEQGDRAILARLTKMVRAFQVLGHRYANLDPLRMKNKTDIPLSLRPEGYDLTPEDLNQMIDLSYNISPIHGVLSRDRGQVLVGNVYERLKQIYLGTIGYEYMHIPDTDKCNWIRQHIETPQPLKLTKADRIHILDRLMYAEHFERFLASKYSTAKRFGLEGAEAVIPGMKAIVHKAAAQGINNIVIGMPHRGRLNVLSNVIRKPLEAILSDFVEGHKDHKDHAIGTGDVKYHLGMSLDRLAGPNQSPIHLSLLANPSHLEAVDPVVCGKTRAKQFNMGDRNRDKAMSVLVHGDAAFWGQGVVFETFGFSQMDSYTTGGTVHIVVNNQVGFTLDPPPRPYCTDIARAVDAPIFHVNADDPEAVVWACELATLYRMRWKTDVVVDVVGFRKHGHNEIDEPSFTQPLMYDAISKRTSVLDIYKKKLLQEGVITEEDFQRKSDKIFSTFEDKFQQAKQYNHTHLDWLDKSWQGLKGGDQFAAPKPTGVPLDKLKSYGTRAASFPADFNIHRRLKGIYQKRKQAVQDGHGIDWATAESLAFATLLTEGHHVRLSGQDVERGTFSHRHAVLHDQLTNNLYVPLNNIAPDQAIFTVTNSSLSEFGVMGFEYGYSLESPQALVLWEAQFGDFANGAQIIIDQFLSSGEDKWLRQSGLVLLLPHGYEGMGPEHSSGRLERFLQMVNEPGHEFPSGERLSKQVQLCNWQVVNVTTPANYFHVLRRQLVREFRKPLIVMSPKSLLRHPMATSRLTEMAESSTFQWIYPEINPEIRTKGSEVRKLLLCSGKVYYDLLQEREKRKQKDVAIIRLEQLAPFPFNALRHEAANFPNAEVFWVQEEPRNQGAYGFVLERIGTALGKRNFIPPYIGRAPTAATATGHHSVHDREQLELITEALV